MSSSTHDLLPYLEAHAKHAALLGLVAAIVLFVTQQLAAARRQHAKVAPPVRFDTSCLPRPRPASPQQPWRS